MARPIVVLPEPDSPTSAWIVPRRTTRSTPSTAGPALPGKDLTRPDASTSAGAGSGAATPVTGRSRRYLSGESAGALRNSRSVYALVAEVSTVRVGPESTMRPSVSTATWSARSAASARSWVMKSTARPSSSCSWSTRSRMVFCTVTSSADVGSSAMSSDGRPAMAAAMRIRWSCPPESSCGKARAARSGSRMPTLASSSVVASRTSSRATPAWVRSANSTRRPTRCRGSSELSGSCGM